MSANCERSQEIDRTSVGVSQWQKSQGATALREVVVVAVARFQSLDIYHIGSQVIDREHNALRVACGTRGVVQQDKLIVRYLGILDILNGKAVWIAFAVVRSHAIHAGRENTSTTLEQHMVVGEREYAFDIRQSILLQTLPIGVGEEQQTALRVVYDMRDIV